MPISKENKIFDKLVKKNYKNELEEVLENKIFGENAKSLLLEILYKIEIAYKDYEVVKKDAKTKDEFIEEYMKNIKQNCKTIKIVKPNSTESKLLDGKTYSINKNKKEIICLPIARKLLYALSKIQKNEKIVQNKYYILSKTLSDLINIGDCINTVEPIREFDGWSWTTVTREIESIEHNLIYQSLLLLVGKKFLYDWINKGDSIIDYLEELENKLADLYNENLAEEIIDNLKKLSILMSIKVDSKMKSEFIEKERLLRDELSKFDKKQEYIQELTNKKNELNKQILHIDETINDKKLLQEEYVKRNQERVLEDKIFSMRVLANLMIEEREEIFKQMEECNSLLKPQNFLHRKEELEKKYSIIKMTEIKNEEIELKEKIKLLQQLFLECFKIKISKAETKQEIIELIYQFRYYCLLPYNKDEKICNAEDIKQTVTEVQKILIQKATETKAIVQLSTNQSLNFEIIKSILTTRIINLEELYIKIVMDKDIFFLQFFDDKINDERIKLDIKEINKKELKIKLNRKIKVFE